VGGGGRQRKGGGGEGSGRGGAGRREDRRNRQDQNKSIAADCGGREVGRPNPFSKAGGGLEANMSSGNGFVFVGCDGGGGGVGGVLLGGGCCVLGFVLFFGGGGFLWLGGGGRVGGGEGGLVGFLVFWAWGGPLKRKGERAAKIPKHNNLPILHQCSDTRPREDVVGRKKN